LLCATALLHAQQTAPSAGSVDSSVTVLGRDDSLIAVPPPRALEDELGGPGSYVLPNELPALAPPAAEATPVSPPLAEIALPPAGEALVLPFRPRAALQ